MWFLSETQWSESVIHSTRPCSLNPKLPTGNQQDEPTAHRSATLDFISGS